MSLGKLHYPTDVCGPLFEEELEYWGLDTNQVCTVSSLLYTPVHSCTLLYTACTCTATYLLSHHTPPVKSFLHIQQSCPALPVRETFLPT